MFNSRSGSVGFLDKIIKRMEGGITYLDDLEMSEDQWVKTKKSAYSTIVQMTGIDLGSEAMVWRTWLEENQDDIEQNFGQSTKWAGWLHRNGYTVKTGWKPLPDDDSRYSL